MRLNGVFARNTVLNTCSACSPLVGRALPHSLIGPCQVSMCHGSPQCAFAAPRLNNMGCFVQHVACVANHTRKKLKGVHWGQHRQPHTLNVCPITHRTMCFGAHFEHLWLKHQPIEYTTFEKKTMALEYTIPRINAPIPVLMMSLVCMYQAWHPRDVAWRHNDMTVFKILGLFL